MVDPKKLLVAELKRELDNRNINSNGRKSVLISRLELALNEEQRQSETNRNDRSEFEELNISVSSVESMDPYEPDQLLNISVSSVDSSDARNESHSDEFGLNIEQDQSERTLPNTSNDNAETHANILSLSSETSTIISLPLDRIEIPSHSDVTMPDVSQLLHGEEKNQVTYTLIPGKRANSEILYSIEERQFYLKKKKLANGVISLECRTDGCNKRCYLNLVDEKCELPTPYEPHNHHTKEEEYKKLNVLNQMKKDCSNPNIIAKREGKTSIVKKIFRDTIAENENSTIQFHRVERTLRRIAGKTLPAAPKTIDQIGIAFENEHVNQLYGFTSHRSAPTQFYRTTYVSDDFSYSVFASQRCIDLIKAHYTVMERKYTMDATFDVTPRLFYQLLIIYFETPSKQVEHFENTHSNEFTEIGFRFIFCCFFSS